MKVAQVRETIIGLALNVIIMPAILYEDAKIKHPDGGTAAET